MACAPRAPPKPLQPVRASATRSRAFFDIASFPSTWDDDLKGPDSESIAGAASNIVGSPMAYQYVTHVWLHDPDTRCLETTSPESSDCRAVLLITASSQSFPESDCLFVSRCLLAADHLQHSFADSTSIERGLVPSAVSNKEALRQGRASGMETCSWFHHVEATYLEELL